MLLPILACAALLAPQSESVLYRGAPIKGSDTRYWTCEDVTLDKDYPQRSNGQGLLCRLGKSKRVLIRFGDLERALGPNRRITSARLVLPLEAASAGEAKLYRFSAPWTEGPGAGEPQPQALQWTTTWESQFFISSKARKWKNGGAEFVAANPTSTAQVSQSSREIVFDGLAADVQNYYEKWYENNGWAVELSSEAAFNSAQTGEQGPRLEITSEAAPEKTGPDLSVVYITRTPEYERYDNRGNAYVRANVGGHESGVMMNPGGAETKKLPADGEEVVYTAYIKNVGDSPAPAFTYTWNASFEKAGEGTVQRSLAPGETASIELKSKFKNEPTDHRTQPIRLRIHPAAGDANAANDALEIQANALNIGIWVDEGFYKTFAEKANSIGTRSFEDWIQWQFRIWNDVFLRHSRFSFAPDGSRERVRVGRITIVPNGTLKGGAHIPNDTPTLAYDGEWGFDSSFGEAAKYMDSVRTFADRALIHEMSHQIGLIDLYWMNVDPSLPDGSGGKVKLKHDGHVVTRGSIDPFGGLMGGGDTRNEIFIHPRLPVLQRDLQEDITYRSPIFTPTDLYSLTDVAALNKNTGYRRGFFGEFLYSVPSNVVVRVTDRNGEAVTDGQLSFYQMKDGQIQDGPPDFVLPVTSGSATLPNRPTGLDTPFTTATGHTLKPNPFGRIDVVGTNGVFLVGLDYKGQREWAWLKVWQLADAASRGNEQIYVHELRFNVTHRPLKNDNWALNKTALDRANSSGVNLAKLVDADPTSIYEASGAEGDWVEIDIGRDRPIGEIRLFAAADGDFWQRFDILVYGTAQTLAHARVYASEADWKNAIAFRRDIDPQNFAVRSVAYRARPQTVRFIRIVNKSGGAGKLGGIIIRETEPGL